MKICKLIFLSVFCSAMSIPQVAIAVDGYKELKFGMSKKQIMSSNVCTLRKLESGQLGVEYYGCDDFIFGGKTVEAGVFFIDGKFLRFAVLPSIDVAFSLFNGLSNKYGTPSSSSTQKEFAAVDSLPNMEAFIAFDHNTVILRIMSDESYMQKAILLYTSIDYDILLLRNQEDSFRNDL